PAQLALPDVERVELRRTRTRKGRSSRPALSLWCSTELTPHKSASVKYLSRGGGFELNALFIKIYPSLIYTEQQSPLRSRRNVKHVKRWTVTSVAALFVAAIFVGPTSGIADDNISPSDVQQGIASSPIPFDKLNLQNRPRALV